MTLTTPVLFIVFNRPGTTQVVFDAIRKVKPAKLYVAADGPRPGNSSDEEKCRLTRQIATNVDWDCEVKTLFREENVGCGRGPSGAYSWFFEQEEEGIILEDDCLPHQTFFYYCQELLEKFRNDTRIMHIAGSNFQNNWEKDKDYSYYFSSYPYEWGWATWRRAWQLYDFNVKQYPELIKKQYFKRYFDSWVEKKYRLSKIANSYKAENANWWDYQWSFTLFSNSGLSIVPHINLIENIGFGEDATHTLSTNDNRKENKAHAIKLPLRHPSFVIRDANSDKRYFKNLFKGIIKRKILSFISKGYNFWG